jgi:putative ABC transport system permease protein
MTAWLQVWRIGAKSLVLHPLRSSLTVLGIFIGVASVIWLLAIGEGIGRKAQEQIEGLGASNIIVRSVKPPDATVAAQQQGVMPYGLTRDDFEVLRDTVPTIDLAIPVRETRRRFSYGTRVLDGRLVGCTPEYAAATQLFVERGSFITDVDNQERKNVCALAAEVAEALFPYEDPLGRSIHVDDAYYVVVGVLKPRQSTAAIGGSFAAQDFKNDVYIPIDTLWARIGDLITIRTGSSRSSEYLEISQITLRVDRTEHVMETAGIIEDLIQRRHREVDYAMTVPLELLEQAKATRMLFVLFMGLIAAISLLVGGIGIMNIMLATVTERTREIGIRRALGARRDDITLQFLAETVLLSVVGGVCGILGGLFCGPVIEWFRDLIRDGLPERFASLPEVVQTMTPIVVPWSVPLAFGISVVVGVLFGLYPAVRAARMDPVEALRHE